MKTIEWNKWQRKAFQDLLREFVAPIDAKAQERRQTGKTPKIPKYASCQNGLNKFLAPWGYACKISLGSWDLSYKPSIAFCRQDILGEGFVNGKKECQKCLAYDKIIDPDGDAYYQESYDDLEVYLESITDYFLHLVNEFNQMPNVYFELEPSASH
ncbi:hypothetical protein [Helicobacter pylori]|uniref:hypothetical protein n=1 Tax=Helicobacter pylori TaxID=210 RepID=UPI000EAF2285|nr:hypothetical protein [Helicobacter pylori]